jgi:hypothetical protein
MENEKNYTMVDIENFINDYKKMSSCLQPKTWMTTMPIIGRKFLERSLLENQKIDFFENAYNKAKTASAEEQEEFIAKMAPVLDDFYSQEELDDEKGMKK